LHHKFVDEKHEKNIDKNERSGCTGERLQNERLILAGMVEKCCGFALCSSILLDNTCRTKKKTFKMEKVMVS